MSNALEKALSCFNGCKADFARELGVTPMVVNHWFRRGVPADRIVDIERVTKGYVKREELRPELYVVLDHDSSRA